MTPLRAMIRAVLASEPAACGMRWIEVRVLRENFTAATIGEAPHTFDMRDAVAEMVQDGEIERLPCYEYRLKG